MIAYVYLNLNKYTPLEQRMKRDANEATETPRIRNTLSSDRIPAIKKGLIERLVTYRTLGMSPIKGGTRLI